MFWFRLFINYRKHTLYLIYLNFKCETNGISQILFGNTRCLLESDENRGVYTNVFERLDRYMAASLCHIHRL